MALFCIGLYSLSTLTADSSVTGIILRLMLCGAGFGLFQTPNNSTLISSAPTRRSGGASGMLGMAPVSYTHLLVALKPLMDCLSAIGASPAFWWLLGGGASYIMGAVFYSLRKPYMHAVFHLFCLGGSIGHILSLIHICILNY